MPPRPSPGFIGGFRAWWQAPRLTWWVWLTLAALLALRKPSALLTPQLWAEDGSIFLMQNDLQGLNALLVPYMGYLHALPRLIAWAASHLLDPRWWPAFYNGAAFAISVSVAARVFSPRLALPGKPWLALAFFLGPHTGEVLSNVTNLQWFTAFLIVQQSLIARPTTWFDRGSDLVLLILAGLTGPFILAFWPLLAWRWWRDRHRDNLIVVLAATACAAFQGWFVMHNSPHFDYQNEPLRFGRMLLPLARRVVVWSVAGDRAALAASNGIIVCAGVVLLAWLIWALRPDPLRSPRIIIVAAFGLIVAAALARTRPDTWASDNLYYGDRYFFIPRVLLAWLLILEFGAKPRAVGWAARGLLAACALIHLRGFSQPAPPDFHWAQYCDPIRRGVPAKIPILPGGWILEYWGRK